MLVLLILKICFSFEISLAKLRHLPNIILEFTTSEAMVPREFNTTKVAYDKRIACAFSIETLWKETPGQCLDIKKEVLSHSSIWDLFCRAYPLKTKAPWVCFLDSRTFHFPFNRRDHRSKESSQVGQRETPAFPDPITCLQINTRQL